MKLYAQHGFGDGEKIAEGFADGSLAGVIFGAKDIAPERLVERLGEIRQQSPDAALLFDPHYYVTLLGDNPNVRLNNLEDYPYYSAMRRGRLEPADVIEQELRKVLEYQVGLPVSGIIAPNVLISRSFEHAEAVIAKNFVRSARKVYAALKDKRPLYATLAISREALADKAELQAFLTDITLLDNRPDGFYMLIAGRSSEARAEIFHADVIAGWMLLNHSLKVNGYEVVNGYSDLVSPFLGAVGGDVGCSGWFNTLRVFSMERFAPTASGGRQPVQRYLSNRLLNRITFIELNALRRAFPELVNGLKRDSEFDTPEPERSKEVLQSWEALNALLKKVTTGEPDDNLKKCLIALDAAENLYARIRATGFALDAKSGGQHIEPLREGIELFKKLAEF
jgi:hypothetical protein